MFSSNVRHKTLAVGLNHAMSGRRVKAQEYNLKFGNDNPPSHLFHWRVGVFNRGLLPFQINLLISLCNFSQLPAGGASSIMELTKLTLGRTFTFIIAIRACDEFGRFIHLSKSYVIFLKTSMKLFLMIASTEAYISIPRYVKSCTTGTERHKLAATPALFSGSGSGADFCQS